MAHPINKPLPTIGVYIFLLLSTIILLYPVIFTQQGTFFILGDNVHLGYASINKLSSSLHRGYFPTWDANCFGGRNFPGGIQTGVFYPLGIIWCYLFGSVNGIDVYYVDLLVVLHYFICLTGMYNLGRLFKMPVAAAIGSALIFTFSGVLGSRSGCETYIFYGLTLLPWAIYFLAKYYWGSPRKRYLIYSGIIGGLQILAGHIQPFFHTLFIAAIMIIFYEYQRRKTWISFIYAVFVPVALILLAAGLVAIPQLYYAAQYLPLSVREVSDTTYLEPTKMVPVHTFVYRYILNPSDYENLVGRKSVLPNDWNFLYMGILPLFLCMFFLLKAKSLKISKDHLDLKRILIITGSIGILSTLGYLTFIPYILYAIPFVNGVRELSRYVIMVSFADALLVGLALTYLKEMGDQLFESTSKIRRYVVLALTLNCVYWLLFQGEHIYLDVSIPFLLGLLFFLILLTVKTDNYVRIMAIAFICLDLCLNPVNYTSTHQILYPTNYYARNRIFNFLETTYGKYRVIFDMKTDSLIRRNLGDIYNIQLEGGYDATLNKAYYDFIQLRPNPEIADLLNIKYIITDMPLNSNFIFKDSAAGLMLYERRNYYPRCYWKHQLGEPGIAIEDENRGTIKGLTYSDLYQKWAVNCHASDTLIFSENIYPGWKCYDNGKEVPIFTTKIKNYPSLFRMISLDKGSHILEFKYNKVFYWF